MRAAHRTVGGGQLVQQPLHLGLIQPHVDLDCRAAGDASGHPAAQIVQAKLCSARPRPFRESQTPAFRFRPGPLRPARLSPRWCDCRKAPNRNRNAPVHRRCAHIRFAGAAVRSSRIGISSCWRSTPPSRLLPQHFLEQNALMRDVLIDDPQAIASGRDDEAVVNLAERPKIGESSQALRRFWYLLRERAVRVGDGCGAYRCGR